MNQDFERMSIFGHSMGGKLWPQHGAMFCLPEGHGALSIYLKNPGTFKSASAFSPAW
jgi:S-formylglutathione hydrolase